MRVSSRARVADGDNLQDLFDACTELRVRVGNAADLHGLRKILAGHSRPLVTEQRVATGAISKTVAHSRDERRVLLPSSGTAPELSGCLTELWGEW
jgi:hypothetical protein